MREERFVEERALRWAELRGLLDRAQLRGIRSLSGAEARRLGALYRAATTDLAEARTFRYSDATVRQVNRLCAAAHGLLYAGGAQGRFTARAWTALSVTFPRVVRRTWRFHAVAAAAVILPLLATWLLLAGDADLAERTVGSAARSRAERLAAMPPEARRYFELPDPWLPVLSWGIMANNIRVTLIGFALGATAGVGTLALLAYQGVHIGGLLAVFDEAGVADLLWTWMAAHGPLELTAIFIACGAGMRLGLSLLVPGRRSRAAAFREVGRESVALLAGTSVMLVAAGLLEGFLSPSDLPAAVKWAAGGVTFALAMAWFALGGRSADGRASGDPA